MAFCTNCGAQMEGAFCGQCGARVDGPASPSPAPTPAPTPAQPPADQSYAAPPPKKNRLLLWGLIGCGGLIVLVLILMTVFGLFIGKKAAEFGSNPGFAAAKMIASMNPDVDVVNADEGTGKITLRDKKSGKTVTLDFQDIQKGRFSFEGEDGERIDISGEGEKGRMTIQTKDGTAEFGTGSLADVPGWIPKYPGAEATGTFTASGKGQDSGGFQLKCNGSVQQVADFYEREMKSAGLTIDKHTMSSGGENTVILHGAEEGGGREITASVSRAEGSTIAHIMYSTR